MNAEPIVPQILFFFLVPFMVLIAEKHFHWIEKTTPIFVCFLLGLLFGNVSPDLHMHTHLAAVISGPIIFVAIALILFSLNLKASMRLSLKALFVFLLGVFSVTVVSFILVTTFSEELPNAWKMLGMLVSLYSGGTPNMSAVGVSLGASVDTIALFTVYDVTLSLVYMIFIMTVAKKLLAFVLPAYQKQGTLSMHTHESYSRRFELLPIRDKLSGMAFSLALACSLVFLGILVAWLFTATLNWMIVILFVSITAALISLNKNIRTRPTHFVLGEYLLLVFALAIGAQSDLSVMLSMGSLLFYVTMCVLFGSFILHVILAMIFRIDTDMLIIASVAAIMSPPFVIPVAKRLNNTEVIAPGLAAGILGLAIGNVLGVTLAQVARQVGF